MAKANTNNPLTGLEIAVIGMSGRFPGARDIEEFWDNITRGVESISFFSDEQLQKVGVNPRLLEDSNYVKVGAALEDIEYFDASFFGYTPKEAQLMDPQVRIFHECAWEALEDASYDPKSYNKLIGVYAGATDNISWKGNVLLSEDGKSNQFQARLLSSKDFLSTQLSYMLNLRGPSYVIYTACSTSLVTVHMACRGLLSGECHVALAGAVSIFLPQNIGYIYQEGMILSSDGHTRAFDAKASGSLFGSGIGIVVLKPLEDAVSDGDHIYAVVKGTAVNNDGNRKIGYTAPSVKGQVEVIKAALRMAEVEPGSISYIEAHGTGTSLGDPIEVKALKQVFNFNTDRKNSCAIGAVKSNFGHLDTAAGITGFIKTVLALKYRLIPPTLHFETPNPEIDFENSFFYVNTELTQWKSEKYPLRAGVSSFGIGGTNAHVVLEEAPGIPTSSKSREWQMILLSTKTESALDQVTDNFVRYLEKNPGINLADAAYTLQVGRRNFRCKRLAVIADVNDAVEALSSFDSPKNHTALSEKEKKTIIFMFAGQGSQYPNMGLELYQKETIFRRELAHCFELLRLLGYDDLMEILYPNIHHTSTATDKINPVATCHPIVFSFEYALAILLMKWGIIPQAMIGYSLGEYVAAAISGVLSLEDALKLVAIRGKLIQKLPPGGMLSVPLSKEELLPLLSEDLSIAIDNGPSCIVSGADQVINAFEKQMKKKRYLCMRIQTSHAIHSKMMAPILKEYEKVVGQVKLKTPRIPYISNVTGKWLTDEQALDPGYWVNHLKETVRFADGIKELLKDENALVVEIGPGGDLGALVSRHLNNNAVQGIITTVRPPGKDVSDVYYLLSKLGYLWLQGVNINWYGFYSQERRHRISLPTYPFQGKRYWLGNDHFNHQDMTREALQLHKKRDIAEWFYIPTWKRSRWTVPNTWQVQAPTNWLVFINENPLGVKLVHQLEQMKRNVIVVRIGTNFRKVSSREYILDPGKADYYHNLFSEIIRDKSIPGCIVHMWGISKHATPDEDPLVIERIDYTQDLGYYSLLNMTQTMSKLNISHEIQIMVVTTDTQEVMGEDKVDPLKSTVIGAVKVIPKEYGNIKLRSIDIRLPRQESPQEEKLLQQLLDEFVTESTEQVVAYRNNQRWLETYEPVRLEAPGSNIPPLKKGGGYLITGGLGGIGLALAQFLAKQVSPKLVLTGRSQFPPRHQWENWLASHQEEDPVTQKIRKIQEMEESGAKILTLSTDVTDRHQVKDMINRAEEQLGKINGIIHCAGISDGYLIQMGTREDSQRIFAPKIKGTLVLDTVFKDREPDFFILCSSLASIIAAPGQVGYCAANIFLDAFAKYKSRVNGTFTLSINWPRWQGVGLAVIQENLHKELMGVELTGGMTIEEGVDVFSRTLGDNLAHVVVSAVDPRIMIEHEQKNQTGIDTFLKKIEKAKNSGAAYQRPDLITEYAPPQNELEKKLANIWQNLFGIEQIGIQDDFLELGGDSLKAITVISRIHKEINVTVPLMEFFRRRTIENLSEYIKKAEMSLYASIKPTEEKEYYALSSAQKRLYIMQQVDITMTALNINALVVVDGELEIKRLEDVFQKLIKRHENLRTSFEIIEKEPVQRIYEFEDMEFEIEYNDLNEVKVEEKHLEGTRGLAPLLKNFIRPFYLSQAPLMRVRLIKLEDQRHILMVDMHHIISDIVSHSLLIRDFTLLYKREKLSELKLQYKDYSEWQKEMRENIGEEVKRQEEFWLKQFEGDIPNLNMPTDLNDSTGEGSKVDEVKFMIEKYLYQKLEKLSGETKTTLYMILLSVYNILLSKYSRQEDIVIGSTVMGRNHPDLENIIGMFVNMLALRNRPQRKKKFGEFLEELKENTLEAFDNENFQFDELVTKLELQGSIKRNPLFEAVFNMINIDMGEHDEGDKISDLKIHPYPFKRDQSQFNILLSAKENNNQVQMTLTYAADLFKRSTIKKMTGHYIEIIEQVVEDYDIRLADIKLSYELSSLKTNPLRDDSSGFDF
jgi:acyl transferase domain-containing protein/acyl carrier protein